MFERFGRQARQAVVGAQQEAFDLGSEQVGTEHLLLALAGGDGVAGRALAERGVTAAGLRARMSALRPGPLDGEALRAFGIDLDAVREAAEDSFGAGALDAPAGRFGQGARKHIPFSPAAKRTLELTLRQTVRLGHKRIDDGHVLLGLLADERFPAARLLADEGVDLAALRADLDRALAA
ncbi:Clp protease N-terminal domain-containing protein [Actinomadura parmotrematis]|uniref:Clp R domain-containing protein n=1 Tax=Actinomadura parmotrematis TaxID=2864039 RepID=A0ABS7FLG2_9ACTN|nr:Clp protease N-terminal domain-containing protein [Actinomadura parmotrematis]MBW8481191.1 hypothetical protein [Actinomadura parmotrematis]